MLGLYLDALTAEGRDRVIEAEDIYAGRDGYFHDGCGCLVGVAEMVEGLGDRCPVNFEVSGRCGWIDLPSSRFPSLCDRFGKEMVIRLCKERAAKSNRPNLREIRDDIVAERQRTAFMYGSTLLGER